MRGGALPPALICTALAFALAFAPRRALPPALALLLAGAAVGLALPLLPAWQDEIFFGCWASVVVAALAVHLRGGVGTPLALVLAGNAGLWAGAVVAVAGTPGDLVRAVPFALLALPARWLIDHRGAIAVKVVSSWLIAVAILAATLPAVPTPGYMPDHME